MIAAGPRPAANPFAGLTSAEADHRRLAGEGNTYRSPTSRTYLQIFKDNSYPLINGPLLLGLPPWSASADHRGVDDRRAGVRQHRDRSGPELARQAPARPGRPAQPGTRDRRPRRRRTEIPPADVVLGDIVVAHRGDEIQLDGRIVGPESASLDESVLTGELRAADKTAGDLVRSGSAVISGVARYEVEAVGADPSRTRSSRRRRAIATSGRRSSPTSLGRSLLSQFSSGWRP